MKCLIYDTLAKASAGRGHCVGYVEENGLVYDVPAGVSAGRNHCIGHLESLCVRIWLDKDGSLG
ncbi:MAG TPA: hypothetical protein IAB98_12100 [Candidatus Egerieimonas intestinavium]|uniref:Uncharacterized protein n=1 Tax=Candidatus Egerieimonas intestinavium TaxID=2840777 RepID=A0A9D1JGS6_9FIRM|nr:hypothetical protein [Candidatus Egerieimonas intestinavium]